MVQIINNNADFNSDAELKKQNTSDGLNCS